MTHTHVPRYRMHTSSSSAFYWHSKQISDPPLCPYLGKNLPLLTFLVLYESEPPSYGRVGLIGSCESCCRSCTSIFVVKGFSGIRQWIPQQVLFYCESRTIQRHCWWRHTLTPLLLLSGIDNWKETMGDKKGAHLTWMRVVRIFNPLPVLDNKISVDDTKILYYRDDSA